MTNINLEIIDYIIQSDIDDNMKNFFISAVIYELRNTDKRTYTSSILV